MFTKLCSSPCGTVLTRDST